jgi:chitinase
VPIIGDTVVENDETFTVTLSNPANATLASGQGVGTGTITNDDFVIPAISISDATVTEGNAGTTTATFTVTLGGDNAGRQRSIRDCRRHGHSRKRLCDDERNFNVRCERDE